MKTADYAVNYIWDLLNESTDIDCPVFKYAKPTQDNSTDYIVVNSLPISAGVLQLTRVNVNYHIKDLFDGVPDSQTLEEMTATLMGLLTEITTVGLLIDFESQEYIRDKATNTHYSNIRLYVKVIN